MPTPKSLLLTTFFLLLAGCAAPGGLRHVVLFKFKDGTSPQEVKAIEDRFRGLPDRIETITEFEWGTDVSEEGKADGFTHCFLVTFADTAGRAIYLPHNAHKEFVALVNGAPYAMAATKPVSSSDISAALEPAGLDIQGSIGDVTYAGRCLVRGKLSGHIVLQGDTAPVTVFLIGEQLVANRATINSDLYSGIVLAQGSGTIAIVSAPGESLEKVEARVRSAIRWAPLHGA